VNDTGLRSAAVTPVDPAPPQRGRRCTGDRGAAATELAIVMPLLLLMVLGAVHIGLWFHARHIANAAAQEGARAARAAGATDQAGFLRADQLLDELGPGALNDRTVTVHRDVRTVTVTVTGRSALVIPGLTLDVSATSTSPIERFTTP
jgi:Flp pilus assembly protein TadG